MAEKKIEEVHNRCAVKQASAEDINTFTSGLRNTSLSSVTDINLSEDDALLILAAKLTMEGLFLLRNAITFVPANVISKVRGSDAALRTMLIHEILTAVHGSLPFSGMTIEEVDCYVNFFQRHCANFMSANTLPKQQLFHQFNTGDFNVSFPACPMLHDV